MLLREMRDFIRDERGGYTIWSTIWFMLYVAIGGLAVDVTDAYRNRTSLQSTADVAALAGVMSLPDEADAVAQALAYAADNMSQSVNGDVLDPADVVVGTWDKDTRDFTQGGDKPNAVRVVTRRAEQNGNPVAMNFLRILSLIGVNTEWDITTEAIAIRYYPHCLGNGLIAQNRVFVGGNNEFVNEVCVHGQKGGAKIQNGNGFDPGVQVSMADMDDLQAKVDSNTGLDSALKEGDMWPRDVERLPEIFEGLIPGEDGVYTEVPDAIYAHDADGNRLPLTLEVIGPDYTGTFLPNRVYYVDCADGNAQLVLPAADVQPVFEKVVVFSECRIHGDDMGQVENIVLASVSPGVGRYPLDTTTVHLSGNADLGTPDGCALGGGIEIYSAASVSLAAGGDINGLRAVVAGNFEMTAGGGGVNGIAVEAGQDIRLTSNNTIGNCPGNNPDTYAWHYRLVR